MKQVKPSCRVALVALALIAAAVALRAQDEDVIRVNTELVVVDAQVLSKKNGTIVNGLNKNDFEIYEDGVKQQIAYFSQDKLPLSIVMLFDLTETVQPVLKPLGRGALDALGHLKPDDEVAVMTYSASAQLIQPFTTDHRLVATAIDRASNMTSGEAAFFNEGVYQATRQTLQARNRNSRTVIIWLTDNVPNVPSESNRKAAGRSLGSGRLHTEQDAFNELFESGAVVAGLLDKSVLSRLAMVFVTKNPLFAGGRKKNPPGDVFKYADQTGGEVLGTSSDEVSQKLATLIDHLRTRYTIGYHPSADKAKGTFCKLKLIVSPGIEKQAGNVLIRSRAGYVRGVERHGS